MQERTHSGRDVGSRSFGFPALGCAIKSCHRRLRGGRLMGTAMQNSDPLNGGGSSSKRTILIVDDNVGVRRMLRTLFDAEGYAVLEAATQLQVLQHLARNRVSLITLDLALGGEDGLAVARAVRVRSSVPIIMITAKGEDVDRVVGLELGADDYISKPFNNREVLARVRAVLRRTDRQADAVGPTETLSFAGYELNSEERRLVTSEDKVVDLTSREYLLLEALVRRPGRVLSRAQLLDLVGGPDSDPLERSIDTLVGRLRRKIETTKSPSLIKTVRGAGYVFTGRVKSVRDRLGGQESAT